MNNSTGIGYTTRGQIRSAKQMTKLDLAKQDLDNHFKIRKGEKWSQPSFGSMLPFYVFQPLDENTIELIEHDVNDVVTYDPRFSLMTKNVRVDQDASSITISIQLLYLPTTTETVLRLKFDREFAEAEF